MSTADKTEPTQFLGRHSYMSDCCWTLVPLQCKSVSVHLVTCWWRDSWTWQLGVSRCASRCSCGNGTITGLCQPYFISKCWSEDVTATGETCIEYQQWRSGSTWQWNGCQQSSVCPKSKFHPVTLISIDISHCLLAANGSTSYKTNGGQKLYCIEPECPVVGRATIRGILCDQEKRDQFHLCVSKLIQQQLTPPVVSTMSDGFGVLGGIGLLLWFTLWLSVGTFALDAAIMFWQMSYISMFMANNTKSSILMKGRLFN